MSRPSSRSVAELAALVGGEVLGDGARRIAGANGLRDASPEDVSFFSHPRYRADLESTRAGAVLVSERFAARSGTVWIVVANPHLAFAQVLRALHLDVKPAPGVHPQADVHAEAEVHPSATVSAFVFIGAGARIGKSVVLHPGAYVGERASIGEGTVLYPHAVVREGCVIGARCVLHASSVIGADGFGFTLNNGAAGPEHLKVPQVGIVRVEDDVEIGACSCIDRATVGETVIGRGSKIDNLVQIAHNVRVGPLSILCAQVGISGSTELGAGVVLAGQVGVVGHLRLGNGARAGAQAGVAQDVPDGGEVSGYPAFEHRNWLRSVAAFKDLSNLAREVRALRAEVDALKQARTP
ncbi:MAG: UDP-3-O-(3-hydroxymyristoyl)glucosamine N-acyltransferase [Myxococcaceae bacterium]